MWELAAPDQRTDNALLAVTCGTIVLVALQAKQILTACTAVCVLVFNLQVLLLWCVFVGALLAAVLSVITGLILLLPLQYLPATKVDDEKTNKTRVLVICVLWSLIAWTWLHHDRAIPVRVVFTLLECAAVYILGKSALWLRRSIADVVIFSLVVPAVSVAKADLTLANGTRVRASRAIAQIRAQAFVPAGESNNGHKWTNLKLAAKRGDTRIDCAYFETPSQEDVAKHDRRWIVWFNGNGELYEFMLPDLQAISLLSGMNILAFNYRGVSVSKGQITQAWDLVEDGAVCVDHLITDMEASPSNIIFFGHSIGGAIAAQLRSHHSPQGPLVVDRSFSTLGTGAKSVFLSMSKALLGFELKLPTCVILGLLSSVFKGSMDAVKAWKYITGPKLILYHLEDEIIKYKVASIHYALERKGMLSTVGGELGDVASIRLGLEGRGGRDYHNMPIEKFPEFTEILRHMRRMVGLSQELPNIQIPRPQINIMPMNSGHSHGHPARPQPHT
eukprot:m.97640 g.97640  ORF g.97640 m.97640 type:complete len:503 (-) comp13606_c0_seq2:40-1548(-)